MPDIVGLVDVILKPEELTYNVLPACPENAALSSVTNLPIIITLQDVPLKAPEALTPIAGRRSAESSVTETVNGPRVKLKEVSMDQKTKKNIEPLQEIVENPNPFVPKVTKPMAAESIKIESIKKPEKKIRASFNDYIEKQ